MKEVIKIIALLLLFFTFFIINIVFIFTIILLEKKRPEKTIAWILLLILLPPFGLIAYLFLGRNWKINTLNKTKSNTINSLTKPIIKNSRNKLTNFEELIDLIAHNSESPLFLNNELTILNGGKEKFNHLKEELLKAKYSINLEYYIVKNDHIGNEIKEILIKKAQEGVKVKFIIDKVGSIRLRRKYIKELKDGGVDVVFYSYILAPLLRFINTQINYRNHRKIVVIDNYVSFIGGINIGDEYLGLGPLGNWRDCHFMIKGDFSLGLQYVFLEDFTSIKKHAQDEFFIVDNIDEYFSLPPIDYGTTFLQFVKSGPDSEFPSIAQSIIKIISMAKKEVNIITPYFIPTEGVIDALKIVLLSGVSVNIMFPEKADHFAVNRASKTYLAELLRCGAKVYLYSSKGFIHTKLITVDNEISIIGTANIDIRSFELNYEINSVIYDKYITNELNQIFLTDLKDCREYTLVEYDSQNMYNKILNGISRLLSSIL